MTSLPGSGWATLPGPAGRQPVREWPAAVGSPLLSALLFAEGA